MFASNEKMDQDQTRAAFLEKINGWRPDLVVSLLNWGDWVLNDVFGELVSIRKHAS